MSNLIRFPIIELQNFDGCVTRAYIVINVDIVVSVVLFITVFFQILVFVVHTFCKLFYTQTPLLLNAGFLREILIF